MLRRLVLVAALAAGPFAAATPAEAAPPYCVIVTSGGTPVLTTCAIGTGCAVYGSYDNLAWCVFWP